MEEDPGTHGEEPMEVIEDSLVVDSGPNGEDSTHMEPNIDHTEVDSTHIEEDSTHIEPDIDHTEVGSTHITEDSTHIEPDIDHSDVGSTHITEDSIHIEPDTLHVDVGSTHIMEDSTHISEDPTDEIVSSAHIEECSTPEMVDSAHIEESSTPEMVDSAFEGVHSALEAEPDVGEEQVVQIIMQEDADSEAGAMPDGQMIQLNSADGMMQYIQVTNEHGENQLIQVSSDGQAQYIQLEGGSELFQISSQPPAELLEEEEGIKTEQTEVAGVTEHQVVLDASSMMVATSSMAEEEHKAQVQDLIQSAPPGSSLLNTSVSSQASHGEVTEAEETLDSSLPAPYYTTAEPALEPVKAEKVVDTSKPIELTSETVVTIGGKKCVLRVDPSTNHLVAYPVAKPGITPGKRPRGRPRKVRRDSDSTPITLSDGDEGSQDSKTESAEHKPSLAPSEQENSAAEGLLGLSEADGRRKSLRVKKKSKNLQDYETGAIEGVEEDTEEVEEPDAEGDPDVPEPPTIPTPGSVKRGRGRPPKNPNAGPNTAHQVQNFLANLGLPVKRGRGRPRRTPPAGGLFNGPIPAFIIPSPGGQAVMMAPVQGLNVQTFQKSGQLADILPKTDGLTSDQLPVVIQNADGTQTHIIRGPPESVKEEGAGGHIVSGEGGADDEDSGEADPLEGTDDSNGLKDENKVGIHTEGFQPIISSSSISTQPTAIITLPHSFVPILLPKKDPVKIGLKASEQDLEKTKCPKCSVQTFYLKQYQEHLQEHANDDDIQKCKCCAYLTFDCDDLLKHFKASHPKCICDECDFTAEHAYVIKRHMLRHSAKGCECEVCGKTYKDQYILKMHIKMVHMPAEVLFECNVCAKKFNRKAHLKRHLRIHEPEKPFKCPHCDYRGCERSDVSKHLLIHEDPQHHCEVCGKTFRHVKNKELHVKRHKGQRDYKCGVCDFYGYTFTDIRKHIERKHADTRTILCDKCGSAFKSDAALREHKRKQCEVVMIEQALAMADVEDHPDDGATVHIPGESLGGDSHILVDGQHVNIGNQVNITVEQVPLHDEDGVSVSLSDGTMVTEGVHGVMVTEDGHIVSQAEVMEAASHPELSHIMEATVIDTSQVDMSAAQVDMEAAQVEMEAAQVEMSEVDMEAEEVDLDDTELVHAQVELVAAGDDGLITIAE